MSRMWGFPRLASTKTILKTAMKTSRRGALRCGLEKVKSMDSDQLEQVAAGVVGPIPQQHLVSTKCDNVFGEDGRFFFGWNDWSPSLGLKAGPMGYQHLLCEGMGLGVQQPSRESAESHHEARVHLPQWKDCEWLISSLEAWNEETHFSVGCASKFLKTQSSIRWYPGSSENLPSRFRNSAVSKRIQVFAPQKNMILQSRSTISFCWFKPFRKCQNPLFTLLNMVLSWWAGARHYHPGKECSSQLQGHQGQIQHNPPGFSCR